MGDYTASNVRDSAFYDDEDFSPSLTQQEKMRDRQLRVNYGVTLDEYRAQLRRQHYRCEICQYKFPPNEHGKEGFVDHDHATGMVRGIICRTCNTGLGFFRDDEERMLRAVQYLLKYRRERPNLGFREESAVYLITTD